MARAFGVDFGQTERWDIGFFRSVGWRWEPEFLVSLGSVLERRLHPVEHALPIEELPIIEKISFGGVLAVTEPDNRLTYKGRLFWAEVGDLIYSKIRVKQGSLAIVPEEVGRLAVSAEYPVYRVRTNRAIPAYLAVLLKSRTFLSFLDGLSHGGSTKTRIHPDQFEALTIALPPLSAQQAIVNRWREAKTSILGSAARAEATQRRVQKDFLDGLGLSPPIANAVAKAFCLPWEEIDRWSVGYMRQSLAGLDPEAGSYPVVQLGDVIDDLENGWSPKCFDRPADPDEWGVLKLGAVSFGEFDETENKALPPNLRPIPSHEIKPGQVLISRANVPRYVGACALVHSTRPRLMICDKIFRVVFRKDSPIDPAYLAEVMKIPHLRRQIETAITGSSPTMQNITKPGLLALRLPLPPLDIQRRLVEQLSAARAFIAAERASADQLARDTAAEIEALILGTKKLDADLSIRTTKDSCPAHPPAPKTVGPATIYPTEDEPAPRPGPHPVPGDAASPRHIPQAILSHMVPARAHSRGELCAALHLTPAEWTWAIRELKESGKVTQEGEKRGARYLLASVRQSGGAG